MLGLVGCEHGFVELAKKAATPEEELHFMRDTVSSAVRANMLQARTVIFDGEYLRLLAPLPHTVRKSGTAYHEAQAQRAAAYAIALVASHAPGEDLQRLAMHDLHHWPDPPACDCQDLVALSCNSWACLDYLQNAHCRKPAA